MASKVATAEHGQVRLNITCSCGMWWGARRRKLFLRGVPSTAKIWLDGCCTFLEA